MFGLGNTGLMLRQGLPLLSCEDSCVSGQPDNLAGLQQVLGTTPADSRGFSNFFYGSIKVLCSMSDDHSSDNVSGCAYSLELCWR